MKSQTEAIAAAEATDQIAQSAALVASLMLALRQLEVPILTGHAVAELIVEDGRAVAVVLAKAKVA